jgi:purine-binding chemotaxis protein CheW
MSRRAIDILKARAQELARPPERVPEAPLSLTLFRRGGQLFGVRLSEVSAGGLLKQLSPVPGAPPWVLGAVHHHGEVLSLLDLPALWGLARAGVADLPTFVVLHHQGRRIGVAVEELLGVHDLTGVPTPYAGDDRAGIHEIARLDTKAILVVSTARLLADPRLSA